LHITLTMKSDLTLSSLRDKGHKITNVRKEVVVMFSQADKPLTAKELHKALKTIGLSVNKTTVYRELQFLTDEGYLVEVHLNPKEASYESTDLIHHHHLICEICGKIDNVTNCLAEELETDVLKKKGFKIVRHSLEFYGTCADCSKKSYYGK
jgi:Fur family transcriptional regulator, ferric uptake regulator